MTSAQLLGRIQAYKFFRDDSIPFDSDEMFVSATLAQREICQFLPALKKRVRLVTVSGQEFYTFPELTPTAVSTATPIQVTTDSPHGLQTGDSALVAGVLGITEANGIRTVTRVDDTNFTLDDSVGSGTYTAATGIVVHAMYSARIISSGRKVSDDGGVLEVVGMDMLDKYRSFFTSNSAASEVVRIGVTFEESPEIAFQGVPGSAITTEFHITRIPILQETISEDLNPILPFSFDEILIAGTTAKYISNLESEVMISSGSRRQPMMSKVEALAQSQTAKYWQLLNMHRQRTGLNRMPRPRTAPPFRMQ